LDFDQERRGAPWWEWEGVAFYDIAIDSAAPSKLYVTAPDGVFKMGASGGWVLIHSIPDGPAPSCLAFAQSVLYLAFKENNPNRTTIVKSTNQGSSWTSLQPSGAELYCFGVDHVHPNRIFVGGGGDLRYSMDSGNSWVTAEHVHVDIHSIAFSPTSTERNYLGTDGGIYRVDYSSSGPMLWYSKNENLAGVLMRGVSLSSDGHMVMGNQDNGTQLYAGGNPPWRPVYGGDGYKPQIDPNVSTKLYYVYYNCNPVHGPPDASRGPVRMVNDVQTNVTPLGAYGESSSTFPAMFMAPGDSARVIMGFQNVWRSLDSGDNWTRIGGAIGGGIDPTGGTIDALYEAPSNSDVIYAVANNFAKVFVTSTANSGTGAAWTDVTPGLPGGMAINAVIVDPTNSSTAYLACSSAVYKTVNMGLNASWTILSAPANIIYHDLAIDPVNPTHIFAASHGGVYASIDGGGTWGSMSAGMPAGMVVQGLSFNGPSRQLAAATYGRGAYVINFLDAPTPTPTSTPTPTPTPTPTATPTPSPGQTPAAPTHLVATAISSSRIGLTWTDNANNETGFQLQRSSTGVTFTLIATLGANVTTYIDNGRAAATTYYYRLRAFNSGGNSALSNVASATTLTASTSNSNAWHYTNTNTNTNPDPDTYSYANTDSDSHS
jgi:hypothetical protein